MTTKNLFRDRRFYPIFFTQFFGAFNDNFFKNALVILVTFKAATLWGLGTEQLVAVAGGIFILPFFLFSASAGQIADRFEKASLIRMTKFLEVAIMVVAAYGFLSENLNLLFTALFLMGLHSTIFGPLKYSYLPQLLSSEIELLQANSLFQLGTFLAILLGTILGGVAIAINPWGEYIASAGGILFACLGLFASFFILPTGTQDRELRIDWNPISPTVRIFQETSKHKEVFLSILGTSWFWFYGAAMLSLFPPLGKLVMGGGEGVVTFFLALFSVGIGLGSMQCKRLSGNKIEPGLVPFGSLGLSAFAADIYFAAPASPLSSNGSLLSLMEFLSHASAWRISIDLFFLSFFGGLYIVPLMTMIQSRSEKKMVSRVIASNNILNSLAMVLASILLVALLGAKVAVPTVFLILSVLNLGVAIFIYRVMPEFTLRFANWILAHAIYGIRSQGTEKIPENGPCVIVCNHVSYVDWMIIQSCCRRPIRFVMDHTFLRLPLVGFLFRDAKVIPIAQAKENPLLKEAAFARVKEELSRGQIVCIFPEGRLTRDGKTDVFRGGIERVISDSQVPVVPMALSGLWTSSFSRNPRTSFFSILANWGKRIDLAVGDPVPPEEVSAPLLEARVKALLDSLES